MHHGWIDMASLQDELRPNFRIEVARELIRNLVDEEMEKFLL